MDPLLPLGLTITPAIERQYLTIDAYYHLLETQFASVDRNCLLPDPKTPEEARAVELSIASLTDKYKAFYRSVVNTRPRPGPGPDQNAPTESNQTGPSPDEISKATSELELERASALVAVSSAAPVSHTAALKVCGFCSRPEHSRPDVDGLEAGAARASLAHVQGDEQTRLIGPFDMGGKRQAVRFAHACCALWAPRVQLQPGPSVSAGRDKTRKNSKASRAGKALAGATPASGAVFADRFVARTVVEELKRGLQLKCSGCRKRGAVNGCLVGACRRSYHLPCAVEAGCALIVEPFRGIYCPTHASQADTEPEPEPEAEPEAEAEDHDQGPDHDMGENEPQIPTPPKPRGGRRAKVSSGSRGQKGQSKHVRGDKGAIEGKTRGKNADSSVALGADRETDEATSKGTRSKGASVSMRASARGPDQAMPRDGGAVKRRRSADSGGGSGSSDEKLPTPKRARHGNLNFEPAFVPEIDAAPVPPTPTSVTLLTPRRVAKTPALGSTDSLHTPSARSSRSNPGRRSGSDAGAAPESSQSPLSPAPIPISSQILQSPQGRHGRAQAHAHGDFGLGLGLGLGLSSWSEDDWTRGPSPFPAPASLSSVPLDLFARRADPLFASPPPVRKPPPPTPAPGPARGAAAPGAGFSESGSGAGPATSVSMRALFSLYGTTVNPALSPSPRDLRYANSLGLGLHARPRSRSPQILPARPRKTN